jgi:hypothetical protein
VAADDFPLLFGIDHPFKSGKESLFRINPNHLDSEVFRESSHYLITFSKPKKAIIHENTGQLITDSFVKQGRSHRGIDPAGETQNDRIIANLFPDTGHTILNDIPRRPLA